MRSENTLKSEKRRPDGWHVSHVCSGQTREITHVYAPGDIGFAYCSWCGQIFIPTVKSERPHG
jgi:hypothetical protein